jgi:HSP20 family molecular chaperone IbpA
MDTSNQAQDAAQAGQQGQTPPHPEGEQIAQGSIEGQQGGDSSGATGVGSASAGQAQDQLATSQRAASGQNNVGVLRPPVDVIEDATGITLLADLPGVSKENLHLRVEAQSLTIEAAMTLDLPPDMEPRHAEVRHRHYERTFALSPELSGDQATAELFNGVLKIRIPKSQEAVPRRIPVNAG